MRTNDIPDTRFGFGKNWQHFLSVLNDDRIHRAEESLLDMLQWDRADFAGKTMLDIGSGSGLFSLAARRLGATVYSFDYDQDSVACTRELKRSYFPNDDRWTIEQGTALDPAYLQSLGQFDLVYSWGVLHHTGNMWQALENVIVNTKPDGHLYISIYNDQGIQSTIWWWIKKIYNLLPSILQTPYALLFIIPMEIILLLMSLWQRNPQSYFERWNSKKTERGMGVWYDNIDWIGGFPFEVATTQEIVQFYTKHGYTLLNINEIGRGHGCNEFVFQRES